MTIVFSTSAFPLLCIPHSHMCAIDCLDERKRRVQQMQVAYSERWRVLASGLRLLGNRILFFTLSI